MLFLLKARPPSIAAWAILALQILGHLETYDLADRQLRDFEQLGINLGLSSLNYFAKFIVIVGGMAFLINAALVRFAIFGTTMNILEIFTVNLSRRSSPMGSRNVTFMDIDSFGGWRHHSLAHQDTEVIRRMANWIRRTDSPMTAPSKVRGGILRPC